MSRDGRVQPVRAVRASGRLYGSKRHGDALRYVVFDMPVLAGVDLRALPWEDRRERLELLAAAFEPPVYLSPLVEPRREIVERITAGELEGLVLKDRTSPYRDGSRAGWWKDKDRSWYAREAWRFSR
jgi:bifunctional non-homologous end joining protein LigD